MLFGSYVNRIPTPPEEAVRDLADRVKRVLSDDTIMKGRAAIEAKDLHAAMGARLALPPFVQDLQEFEVWASEALRRYP